MEALIRSIDPRQLLTFPLVDWIRLVLNGNGRTALARNLIEERKLYKEARGEHILRRAYVGIKGYRIWSVENRTMNPPQFCGLGRAKRQIVGGRNTPSYGRYEIWSQVELQPNADSRTFTIHAADVTLLDEPEWRKRKNFEEAVMEAVRKPAKFTTYVMDHLAGNDWSNPYWIGTDITHLP